MRMGKATLVGFGTVLLSLLASACTVEQEEVSSSSEQPLTERDWSRAVSYLRNISYLPWGYTDDGCYARALYYTMNLAAEGIASNHVYIVAKSGYGLGSTGAWSYHVAPLVSRDGTGELLVLDPIWVPSNPQPIRLTDWYTMQTQWEGTANAPELRVSPGNTYGQRGSGTLVPDPMRPSTASFREPATFSAMPSFSIANINAACDVMHRYIDAEASANAASKHHDLSRDTKRLVTALADRGKLSGNASDLSAECTRFAPELASCPTDTRQTNPGSRECCLASAFWCQANGVCNAPGTIVNGLECGAGGNLFDRTTPNTNGGATSPGAACPADSATTNPGSMSCCLASRHWCWSSSGQFCAAPGTERNVGGVDWRCGPSGEWVRY